MDRLTAAQTLEQSPPSLAGLASPRVPEGSPKAKGLLFKNPCGKIRILSFSLAAGQACECLAKSSGETLVVVWGRNPSYDLMPLLLFGGVENHKTGLRVPLLGSINPDR